MAGRPGASSSWPSPTPAVSTLRATPRPAFATCSAAELRRGLVELGESRTGYGVPIAVAVAAARGEVVAALPISPELRADPGAVGERSGALAAAAVEHVVEGASPGPPRSARRTWR